MSLTILLLKLKEERKDIFPLKTGYKIQDSYWDDFESTFGGVPFGFNGSGSLKWALVAMLRNCQKLPR